MSGRASSWVARAAIVAAASCQATAVWAGVHTWDVNEVFSDPTGQIQFVELKNPPATSPAEEGERKIWSSSPTATVSS